MKIHWHALTALPFALSGHPEAALFALLPDATWIPHEWAYRRALRATPTLPWHRWVQRDGTLRPSVLRAYRTAHSVLVAAVVCIALVLLWSPTTAGWVAAGWATHLALDLFTHDGPLRLRPLYPVSMWRWPYVAKRYAWNRQRGRVELVLLSGGWESAACLALAVERAARTGARVIAVHFQYGQPYGVQEMLASARLAATFGVHRDVRAVQSAQQADGVFDNRNERFVEQALRTVGGGAQVFGGGVAVWFGGRAPLRVFDRHGDSNAQWVTEMERKYGVRIHMPLWMHPKWLVKARARMRGVTDDMVFSSEGWKYQ